MALHIKALNNDTSFLLTFIPSICPAEQKFPETFPGAFTILIDPIVPLKIDDVDPKPSSCISSLNDIAEPDAILISQTLPDHCHEESLCQLSPHIQSMIVGEPNAIKKVKRWKHFDLGNMYALRRYKNGRKDTLFRVELPPPSPLAGSVHNAIGITYREPGSVLSRSRAMTGAPPSSRASSAKPMSSISSDMTFATTAASNPEPTLSVLYSPYGVSFDVVQPWILGHLVPESALPLVAMLHSTTVVDAPWYSGGNISTGYPGGFELARRLMPTTWIAANDRHNVLSATAKKVVRKDFDVTDAQMQLWNELAAKNVERKPKILRLNPGETLRVDRLTAEAIVKAMTRNTKEEEKIANPEEHTTTDHEELQ
ncbi:hypothetical protein, variant [Verruconis gallopava]|uniref:Metallo-beta-lactamase domain-containing protein n=1 Tax=Verruconis gallopava TaxID=253628 RepID=A0A0D2A847_9PEZI|nr:hypothetical protein, variant [Verruconis gallopava]KIW02760.1 hypothetical protein, variant [Verruconis gallopava]